MNLFKWNKIHLRLSVYVGSIVIIAFFFIFIFYTTLRNRQVQVQTREDIINEIQKIHELYNIIVRNNKSKVISSLRFTTQLFKNSGNVTIVNEDSVKMISTDKDTRIRKEIYIPKWYINDTLVQYNNLLADQLTQQTDISVGIFQKIPEGFIQIATTVFDNKGDRQVGLKFPNSDEIVKTVKRGLIHLGKSYYQDEWHLTAYEPLYINNKLEGLIFIGVKEIDKHLLKDFFEHITLYNSYGYPFILNKNGNFLIHTKRENDNLKQTDFFSQFTPQVGKLGYFSYYKSISDPIEEIIKFHKNENIEFPVNIGFRNSEKQWYHVFYKYDYQTENYISFLVPDNILISKKVHFRNNLILFSIFLFLIIIVLVYFFIKPVTSNFASLQSAFSKLSNGLIPDKIKREGKYEFKILFQHLNKIIQRNHELSQTINLLQKGNFRSKFELLSTEDQLGKSVKELQDKLQQEHELRQKREVHEEKQRWISSGMAKFDELLRVHSNNFEVLVKQVISNFVSYTNANQGGIFLINDEDKYNKYVELIASYAYNKERKIHRQFQLGVGLIGRSIQEKKILHIKEIPSDYVYITSGLGERSPKAIVIAPLLIGNEVLGVIEAASFKEFDETTLNFIKKVTESIAVTISTVKMNSRTTVLLERSQQQAEELAAQEEEMRQNLEELQSIQEASSQRELELKGILHAINNSSLVIEYNMMGEVLNINDQFLMLLNITRERLRNITYEYFISKNEIKEYEQIWEKLRVGQVVKKETRVNFPYRELWLSETFAPILDDEGMPYKIIDIAVDITESKKLKKVTENQETKLSFLESEIETTLSNFEGVKKELEEHYAEKLGLTKALFNSSIVAFYNLDGEILEISTQFLSLISMERSQMMRRNHREFYYAGDKLKYQSFWQELSKGKDIYITQLFSAPNGKEYTLEEYYYPILDRQDKPVKIVCISKHISL